MKKSISIIGAGASALMLGNTLDTDLFSVSIYEKNAAFGRKFLVAGYGGLNITHSEQPELFIERYSPSEFLKPAFNHFNNHHLVQWLKEQELATYIGSSKRVFPLKSLKPTQVLNRLVTNLQKRGVKIYYKHEWIGFSDSNDLLFKTETDTLQVKSDLVIFCLGGASWPVTGSNTSWPRYFENQQIVCAPFEASNCEFKVHWKKELLAHIEGQSLKNIVVSIGNKQHAGEIVITKEGIEGSGIYALSPEIRQQLKAKQEAMLSVDLKPKQSLAQLVTKLQGISSKKSYTEQVKEKLNLTALHMHLLKATSNKEEFLQVQKLAEFIKDFRLSIHAQASVSEAISTVGGIELHEINAHYELKKFPKHFVIGEMLNYDAPTGGYLLQSCFSMANYVAKYLNNLYSKS